MGVGRGCSRCLARNAHELGWFREGGDDARRSSDHRPRTHGAALPWDGEKPGCGSAPGFYADIVAVEGDPLADIDVVIHHVQWVMKGGRGGSSIGRAWGRTSPTEPQPVACSRKTDEGRNDSEGRLGVTSDAR